MQELESDNLEKARIASASTPKVAAALGAMTSAAAVVLLSGDWACSALGAAIISAFLCAIVAYVLEQVIKRRLRARWVLLTCLVIAIALAQSLAFRASLRRSAFVDAFGSAPPETVRELRVARY